MTRKRNRLAVLKEGEVDIAGAAVITGRTVSTLYTYFSKLEKDARPPLEKRAGILVGKESELREWREKWDAGAFYGATAGM